MSTQDKRRNLRLPEEVDLNMILKYGVGFISAAVIFMVSLFFMSHYDVIRLYPSKMSSATLEDFASRVEYALRYQTLLALWLIFNIILTIYHRLKNMAVNPLDTEKEVCVQLYKNVLTNSMEGITVSVLSQLIFVSFAEPVTVLKTIPVINIVQFIGRICFLLGYPWKRAFGFHCMILPNIALVSYNLIKFGSFLGFY